MTIQYVNTGSGANSGDGDSLRTAFYKINNNFAELSAISGTDTSVIIINSFPPNTSTEGTIWFDTVSGRNFIYYDGFWVDAAPPAVEPINLTTVTSHILPGANLTYDLGSTSSQWRSLYVGSSTIYLGGTPLSISNGRLTVNGVDSSTTSSLNNNGSSLSIDSTGTTLFLPSGNSVIRSFNNISQEGYNNSIIELIPDFELALDNNHQYIVIDPNSAENHVHIRTGGPRDGSLSKLWLGGNYNHVVISDPDNSVKIGTDNGSGQIIEWEFDNQGKLTLPTTIHGAVIDFFKESPNNHMLLIDPDWRIILQARATTANDGHIELQAGQNTKILIHGDGSNIDFIASDGSTTKTWSMNLSGELVFPDGTTQTTAYESDTESWNLSPGSNTVSFTVTENASYTMWVRGNIPNGIIVWNATVSLSNTNVPVIGNQYGWYYAEGNNLVLDSIPDQIIGTSGSISSATVVTTSSNVFTFGITNNSTSTQTVYWGYVTI